MCVHTRHRLALDTLQCDLLDAEIWVATSPGNPEETENLFLEGPKIIWVKLKNVLESVCFGGSWNDRTLCWWKIIEIFDDSLPRTML